MKTITIKPSSKNRQKKSNSLFRVLGLFSEFKWRMAAVLVLGVISVYMFSMIPTYTRKAFNSLNSTLPMDAEISYILWVLGVYVGLQVFSQVFNIICIVFILKYEAKAIQQATVSVKHKLDLVPTSFLERYTAGDLTRIIAYNVSSMMKGALTVVYKISRAVFFYITTSIAMFAINPTLAIVVISSLPVCVLVARFVSKRTQKHFNSQAALSGKMSTYLDQKIALHGFYKMHGLDGQMDEFIVKNDELTRAQIGEVRATGLNTFYITFIKNSMNVLITVLCCVFFINNWLDGFGALPAFLMYSQSFLDNAVVVTDATNLLQLMGARADRIFEVLDSADDVTEKEHIKIKKIGGQIVFKNVSLYSNGEKVVSKVSFVIPQGASVAFVGPAGGGKSKLVELIAKLDVASEGEILVDGINLDEINRVSYYDRMGVAFERPFIFRGTVAENIVYGVGRALPENVMDITRKLNSHYFIDRLPRGYETEINENTEKLSLSQKQAINVARTVLQSPDLVIFDNAMSKADGIIEKQVFEQIMKLDKKQTKIFITHRLASIQNCDIIMFMEKGKIIEQGTHEQLMSKKRKYYKAFTG